MTQNQREFQKQVARIEREMKRLLKRDNYVPVYDIPDAPKRVTRKMITRLEELSGRNFVAKVDTDTGEVLHHPNQPEIYSRKGRLLTGVTPREYDPERARQYREEHREQIRESARRYREAHKEQIKAKQKAYREAHKEQIKEKQKAYRQKNRERINARARERRQRNRDAINAKNRENYIPTFNIIDEIIERFRQAENEVRTNASLYPWFAYEADKLRMLGNLITTVESNRDSNPRSYNAYLKAHEARIAELIQPMIYASTQEQLETPYTELLFIIRRDQNRAEEFKDDSGMIDLSSYADSLMEIGEF